MRELDIQREIKHKLNVSRRCRLVRNNTGVDVEKGVRYGLGNGGPDLVGMLPGGLAFGIEVKTPSGHIDKDQIAWWKAAYGWGFRGGVARSLAGAWRLLDEAEAGIRYTELVDYE